jgi:ketosteroid isomerase-like protein
MNSMLVFQPVQIEAAATIGTDALKAQSIERDRAAVSSMDLQFQAATKANDYRAIDHILHKDYVLVLGSGKVISRQSLIDEARAAQTHYQIQDEEPGSQTVRMFGDTAVVTAKLWIKGEAAGKLFDRKIWFSDVYLRTADGWRYAFAQTSGPLPPVSD